MVRGVCSAGFTTMVFPQQRAGASFHASIRRGKFHCNRAQRNVGGPGAARRPVPVPPGRMLALHGLDLGHQG